MYLDTIPYGMHSTSLEVVAAGAVVVSTVGWYQHVRTVQHRHCVGERRCQYPVAPVCRAGAHRRLGAASGWRDGVRDALREGVLLSRDPSMSSAVAQYRPLSRACVWHSQEYEEVAVWLGSRPHIVPRVQRALDVMRYRAAAS